VGSLRSLRSLGSLRSPTHPRDHRNHHPARSIEQRMFMAVSSLTRYLKTYGTATRSTYLDESQTRHTVRPLEADPPAITEAWTPEPTCGT